MVAQCIFTGESMEESPRGNPVVKGILTLRGHAGDALGSFKINTGGGASSYRRRNGPLPPGDYRVSSYRERTKKGMVLHGVGYSFNLDPLRSTEVYGRSLFRIHPDGGYEQTNGCLGVREGAGRLRACRDQLRRLIQEGHVEVSIVYDGLGVP